MSPIKKKSNYSISKFTIFLLLEGGKITIPVNRVLSKELSFQSGKPLVL
jgi:hypothetical protein